MSTPRVLIDGVCPVLETPFLADGALDEAGVVNLANHQFAVGARHVMLPGFASEFHKLTDAERSRLTELAVSAARQHPGAAAIVSIADHATHVASRRAEQAVAAGAAAINVLPPHLLSPSPRAVIDHLETVAAVVAPVPVVIQYAPALTGTTLSVQALHQIAQRHPNVVQVKVESTPPGAMISALAAGAPELSAVVGYAGVQLIDALRRGAVGVQPGCSFTEIYLTIWDRWARGDQRSAIGLHHRLLPYISYWMQEVELVIAAEKHISMRRGLIEHDHCRSPARVLDDHERRMIDAFLSEFAPELAPTGS